MQIGIRGPKQVLRSWKKKKEKRKQALIWERASGKIPSVYWAAHEFKMFGHGGPRSDQTCKLSDRFLCWGL
jgi:hypothetical protein